MSTSAASTSQHRLNLLSLHCVRKQDAIGRDEPKLLVNGVTKFGPGNLGKGESVDLRPRFALFSSVAEIELIEVDGGGDNSLGTITAEATQAGEGAQQGEFSTSGADYKITYEVVPA